MKRREDLSTPRQGPSLGVHYDPEAFGRFSEAIARTLGTARFLVIQTVVVVFWIALNVVGFFGKWDPYPFILLNLAFSTQAAYAAPLILLAQSRQAERDRVEQEQDRLVNARVQADTDFLAREIATVRLSLSDVVTTEDLTDAVSQLTSAIERLASSEAVGLSCLRPPRGTPLRRPLPSGSRTAARPPSWRRGQRGSRKPERAQHRRVRVASPDARRDRRL